MAKTPRPGFGEGDLPNRKGHPADRAESKREAIKGALAPLIDTPDDVTIASEIITRSYIETLLWTDRVDTRDDAGDETFDETFDEAGYGASDIAPSAMEEIKRDCADFYQAQAEDLATLDDEQSGHDFALTRNRHGAGFWDRGLGELEVLAGGRYPGPRPGDRRSGRVRGRVGRPVTG